MLVLVAAGIAAGCADSGSDVRGNVVHRFYGPGDDRDVPADLTGYRYQVYSAGELIPQDPVAGTEDGTFRIANVPDGAFLLRIESPNGYTRWLQEEQHDLTIIEQYVGRPDAVPASGNVPLTLHLDGLSPWAAGDLLVVNCWENGTELTAPSLNPTVAIGASAIDSTFDWNSGYSFGPSGKPYLMDPVLGDMLTISHLTESTPQSGITVSKLTQLVAGPGVAQDGAMPASFSGAFADVPLSNAQHFVLDLDTYADALPAPPIRGGWGVSLLKNPAADAGEIIGPSLLSVSSLSSQQPWIRAGQVDLNDTFGAPFDASWPTMVRAGYEVYVPGTTGPFDDEPRYYAYTNELLRSPVHVVSIFAAFVRSVTLNGQALEQAALRQDPRAPFMLAVDLPSEAQRFTLVLSQWVTDANGTTLVPRISIESSQPEIELPASAVPSGQYYAWVWATLDQETTHSAAYRDIGKFVVQ